MEAEIYFDPEKINEVEYFEEIKDYKLRILFLGKEDVEEINKKGLENVAELCADFGCSLIFPSSTSVYGTQDELVDEDCPEEDLKPQSPYADSKIFGERLTSYLVILSQRKNLPLDVLLRLI